MPDNGITNGAVILSAFVIGLFIFISNLYSISAFSEGERSGKAFRVNNFTGAVSICNQYNCTPLSERDPPKAQ